jgi:hypothetical protein
MQATGLDFQKIKHLPGASPLYFKFKDETKESNFTFGKHFNPDLARDSVYFNKLDAMMSCVQRNVSVSQDRQDEVCKKEFKALRIAAFEK